MCMYVDCSDSRCRYYIITLAVFMMHASKYACIIFDLHCFFHDLQGIPSDVKGAVQMVMSAVNSSAIPGPREAGLREILDNHLEVRPV